jgi:hypothetical protein
MHSASHQNGGEEDDVWGDGDDEEDHQEALNREWEARREKCWNVRPKILHMYESWVLFVPALHGRCNTMCGIEDGCLAQGRGGFTKDEIQLAWFPKNDVPMAQPLGKTTVPCKTALDTSPSILACGVQLYASEPAVPGALRTS